ncbi:hypothetical protein O4H49_04300 [Kiloniella laminariae]|uniref:HEPN domain-containing protein n=1 Tax=Kiloniella laminariae TaxID=454162 RepID=A0ABT4LFV1_9PROT|nr:hypothetical protein [Kiloniella laminariae]MCZ4279986.1 hypothetical protein [Kiloniella laminariae]
MSDDPFFALPEDSNWNALIGKQGYEENYVDGYIGAAQELANIILEKDMYHKRDTLVLPILYNARHGIELTLKMTIDYLVSNKILSHSHPKNHNLNSHLNHLINGPIPDEEINQCLIKLRPFIESLARIDNDGQELRFHKNKDGSKSMPNYSLVNIETLQNSLKSLSKILSDLKYRTFDYCREIKTKSHTSKCSRNDLFNISKMLPKRSDWGRSEFNTIKTIIKKRYGLSNKQFSLALDKILINREMCTNIDIEHELLHIRDDRALFLIQQWLQIHPPRAPGFRLPPNNYSSKECRRAQEARHSVIKKIENHFSIDELADFETIFYLARDKIYTELYEQEFEIKRKEYSKHNKDKNLAQEIHGLLTKTNFATYFSIGTSILGRPSLSRKINELTQIALPYPPGS